MKMNVYLMEYNTINHYVLYFDTCTVLLVVKFPRVSRYPTVSHGIPQITTGDIVSRQFCGNHPCLKISVIIPGRQPCPMVITEIFRNGPYYHGTQYVPWEFVGHRGTPWDTVGHRKLYHRQYCRYTYKAVIPIWTNKSSYL